MQVKQYYYQIYLNPGCSVIQEQGYINFNTKHAQLSKEQNYDNVQWHQFSITLHKHRYTEDSDDGIFQTWYQFNRAIFDFLLAEL